MPKKLRIGALSCGGNAHGHAALLSQMPAVEQVAFCDIVEEKARRFSQEFSGGRAAVFTDFRQMFKQTPMDIVCISLPPFAHTNEVEMAASLGVHIFIEKPIALTMAKADRMVSAIRKAGVKSQVGFQMRFGEATERVKAMIDSGETGPVSMVTARYLGAMTGATHWWREKDKSGGQLVEQAIHTYDLVRYLVGEPETIYSSMSFRLHEGDRKWTNEDASGSVIKFPNGALATVSATGNYTQWVNDLQLIAKHRCVDLVDANNATIHHVGALTSIAIASQKNAQLAMHQDFLSAVRRDRPTRTPIEEGRKSLQLVLAAGESAKTGKVVRLS
jgi:predicted dehydrogenase